MLQAQIDSLDRENLRLQRDIQQQTMKGGPSPRPVEKDKSVTPTPQEFVQDFRHIERQEGEVTNVCQFCPEGCHKMFDFRF